MPFFDKYCFKQIYHLSILGVKAEDARANILFPLKKENKLLDLVCEKMHTKISKYAQLCANKIETYHIRC